MKMINVLNPSTTAEALAMLAADSADRVRAAAGCTDVLLQLRRQEPGNITLVNLTSISDATLTSVHDEGTHTWLGSRVTAYQITQLNSIARRWPVLHQAASVLASVQIRHVATIGGNVCTSSPSGDLSCALMAIGAICVIKQPNGDEKEVPIEDFFTGPGTNILEHGELLYGVRIPAPRPGSIAPTSGFHKVGTRRAMECSVVSLAWHIECGGDGVALHAGVAIGAVAPTVRSVQDAQSLLIGHTPALMDDTQRARIATAVMQRASPISDIRASAGYRLTVLGNIVGSMFSK